MKTDTTERGLESLICTSRWTMARESHLHVLNLLAAGASPEEILADFPYLEPADITAALEYAARQLDHAVVTA